MNWRIDRERVYLPGEDRPTTISTHIYLEGPTMTERTPAAAERLREALDKADITWQEVRGAPGATYLPDTRHTIWWQGPTILEYLWGHDFEFHDPTPEAVIERLGSLS